MNDLAIKSITKLFLLLLVCSALASCKKQNKSNPDKNTGNSVYLLGLSRNQQTSFDLPTLWSSSERSTNFVTEIKNGSIIGAHILPSNLWTSLGEKPLYFGYERINYIDRAVIFINGKRHLLSALTNHQFPETTAETPVYFITDSNGNTHIYCVLRSDIGVYSYLVYTINSRALVTYKLLPFFIATPYIFQSESGIEYIATETDSQQRLEGLLIRNNEIHGRYDFSNLSSKPLYERSMFIKDTKVFAIMSEGDLQSDERSFILATADTKNGEVKKQTLRLPSEDLRFSKGIMVSNIIHLPAYDEIAHIAYHLSIDVNNPAPQLEASYKILEAGSERSYPITKGMIFNDNKFYVFGTQGVFACYWEDGKLIQLNNHNLLFSIPITLLVF